MHTFCASATILLFSFIGNSIAGYPSMGDPTFVFGKLLETYNILYSKLGIIEIDESPCEGCRFAMHGRVTARWRCLPDKPCDRTFNRTVVRICRCREVPCGRYSSMPRIENKIRGGQTIKNDYIWPWIVRVLPKTNSWWRSRRLQPCTGVLIAATWVITSADCVNYDSFGSSWTLIVKLRQKIEVKNRLPRPSHWEDIEIPVKQIFKHKYYRPAGEYRLALLKLIDAVRNISYPCRQTSNFLATTVYIAGYGARQEPQLEDAWEHNPDIEAYYTQPSYRARSILNDFSLMDKTKGDYMSVIFLTKAADDKNEPKAIVSSGDVGAAVFQTNPSWQTELIGIAFGGKWFPDRKVAYDRVYNLTYYWRWIGKTIRANSNN